MMRELGIAVVHTDQIETGNLNKTDDPTQYLRSFGKTPTAAEPPLVAKEPSRDRWHTFGCDERKRKNAATANGAKRINRNPSIAMTGEKANMPAITDKKGRGFLRTRSVVRVFDI